MCLNIKICKYWSNLGKGLRQRVALYSAYRQRVGDTGSVAAAKLSVSARHAKRAWLEPWVAVARHNFKWVYLALQELTVL